MPAAPWVVSLAQSSYSGVFVWAIALILLLVVLFGVLAWLRRRLSPNEDFSGEGFTLGDLRRLHKSGQLSDDEFERAKEGLIAAAQAAQQRKQDDKKPGEFGLGGRP